jgi:hypothetical protein
MAKFTPAPDIWTLDDSARAKLQPGQWIKCGEAAHLSRFYRFNPATGHVTAFHGPNATRKLREYVKAERAALVARDIRRGLIPPHVKAKWKGERLANRGGWPVWSGKQPVPTVGQEVRAIGGVVCCVTGYEVDSGFLMIRGYRVADGREGNLAGAEIIGRN